MNRGEGTSMSRLLRKRAWGLLGAAALGCTSSGCIFPALLQTTIGGQTLPSAWYLRDDVQYFPHGPEFLLPETVRAHEEYRLQQEAIDAGLIDVGP
jgi:hypothetical protein